MKASKVYIALLHYPMRNKKGETVSTSVTNLDLHDIARVARSYGIDGFYVVHPCTGQQELVKKILAFWQEGYGGQYNPDRREALTRVRMASSLEQVVRELGEAGPGEVCTVGTDASPYPQRIRFAQMREKILKEDRIFLILFGTGWGMSGATLARCDYILEPIQGASDYNHLSVRSAVSIVIDRLLGECWFQS